MGSSRATDTARRRRRALITRPLEDAVGLAAALAERGIDVIIEPLLTIEYFDAPMANLAGVQAVLCTSANGVRALARLSPERNLMLLAVGAASATRAQAEGFQRVESAGGDVGDLARLAEARLNPMAGPLLHVAGSAVAGDLVGVLRARGFIVERAVLYAAHPADTLSPAAVQALHEGKMDIALFFSPRTAAIFARLVAEAGLDQAMRGVTAVSISAAADRALASLPFCARDTAGRPDQPALLAALDRLVATGCPT